MPTVQSEQIHCGDATLQFLGLAAFFSGYITLPRQCEGQEQRGAGTDAIWKFFPTAELPSHFSISFILAIRSMPTCF